MNSDSIATLEVVLVLMVEVLFGVGFNALVAWARTHRLWHVSVSVAVGVAGTMVVPAVMWPSVEVEFWRAGLLLLMCFVGSGVPMIVGSTRRSVDESKDRKKRRPWPNAALQARDAAVMELSSLAHEIAEDAKENRIAVLDLPDYVNRLHGVIGTLKNV